MITHMHACFVSHNAVSLDTAELDDCTYLYWGASPCPKSALICYSFFGILRQLQAWMADMTTAQTQPQINTAYQNKKPPQLLIIELFGIFQCDGAQFFRGFERVGMDKVLSQPNKSVYTVYSSGLLYSLFYHLCFVQPLSLTCYRMCSCKKICVSK